MKKKTIVHVVTRDKFTSGYINFMKQMVQEYQHCFVLRNVGFDLKLVDDEYVYCLENDSDLRKRKDVKKLLCEADLIVASGFFELALEVSLLPKAILNKTYVHFWGGDFYRYRTPLKLWSVRNRWYNAVTLGAFKKMGGFIFLIEGEYEKFKNITGIQKRNFVAPMPDDVNDMIDFAHFRKQKKSVDLKILVGNSATPTNQHIEVFEMLSRFTEHPFEVICPLSYGEEWYREEVIKKGYELLGKDHFKALTGFIDKSQYTELLSQCQIGIFNNNRQQAMGNINYMLALGKKVFIRQDTSMWNKYKNEGYSVFAVEDIPQKSYDEFVQFDEQLGEQNGKNYEQLYSAQAVRNKWMYFFENVCQR